MSECYKVALVCGVAPLIVGVATFLLWLLTRWDTLMSFGLVVVIVSHIFFIVGCLAVVVYVRQARRDAKAPRLAIWFRALGATLLLLVNFPVAHGIIKAVVAISNPGLNLK